MKWKYSALFALMLSLRALPGMAQAEEPSPPPPSYGEAPVPQEAPPAETPAPAIPPPPKAQPLTDYAPAPPDAVPTGIERHDGFYLRAALGFAGIDMERSTEGQIYTVSGDWRDSSVSGAGGMSELSIGGTPAPGVVIAGTLLLHQIAKPSLKRDNAADVKLDSPLTFAVLGGTIDWYPNPHGGFHLGGTLGLGAAGAKTPSGSAFDSIGGAGGAFSIAIGYDWWVGDEWSIGVLGRLSGARIHGESTERIGGVEVTGKEDSNVSAAGVMFSVLYH